MLPVPALIIPPTFAPHHTLCINKRPGRGGGRRATHQTSTTDFSFCGSLIAPPITPNGKSKPLEYQGLFPFLPRFEAKCKRLMQTVFMKTEALYTFVKGGETTGLAHTLGWIQQVFSLPHFLSLVQLPPSPRPQFTGPQAP